jgi:hypothetical protein
MIPHNHMTVMFCVKKSKFNSLVFLTFFSRSYSWDKITRLIQASTSLRMKTIESVIFGLLPTIWMTLEKLLTFLGFFSLIYKMRVLD